MTYIQLHLIKRWWHLREPRWDIIPMVVMNGVVRGKSKKNEAGDKDQKDASGSLSVSSLLTLGETGVDTGN